MTNLPIADVFGILAIEYIMNTIDVQHFDAHCGRLILGSYDGGSVCATG